VGGDFYAYQGGAGGGQGPRKQLGNPNGAAALWRAGKDAMALRAAVAANADRHAQDLAPVLEDIRALGCNSLRAIAAELTTRGMLTCRGGRWHVSTVSNMLGRLRQEGAEQISSQHEVDR
jgi:hypothetical protein